MKSIKGIVGVAVVLVIVAIVVFAFFWEEPTQTSPDFDLAVREFTCVDQNATFNVTVWNNGSAKGDAVVRYTVWNETTGAGLMLVNESRTYRDIDVGTHFNETETFKLGAGPFGQESCGIGIRWDAKLV